MKTQNKIRRQCDICGKTDMLSLHHVFRQSKLVLGKKQCIWCLGGQSRLNQK